MNDSPTGTARNWKVELVPLAVAFVVSTSLALERAGAIDLPACGAGSACVSLMRNAATTLPGVGWPAAVLGVAWFGGWIAYLAARRGTWTIGARLLGVAGVLTSLALLMFMIAREELCPWYTAVHVANLAWWWLARRRPVA